MNQTVQRGVLVLMPALVAACATTPVSPGSDAAASRAGAVGVSEISQAVSSSPRMVLGQTRRSSCRGADAVNALPVYPTALLARRLPPRSLCPRVSIGAGGQVLATAPIEQAPDCPTTVEPQFSVVAAQAASGWHFDPGVRCEYPNEAARIAGDCSGGRETAHAVSLSYRFVFEQHDGRGSVRLSNDGPTQASP